MNRKSRRIAEAKARALGIEPVIAYHESGHAVARLIVSKVMGYEPEAAVNSIDVGSRQLGTSADGRVRLVSQAVCYGPMVSNPLRRAISEAIDMSKGVDPKTIWDAFSLYGSDEERQISMRSRMLIDVMGAAAEAHFAGNPDTTTVFYTYACEDDRSDFVRNCKVLALSTEETMMAERIFLEHAQELVARPHVWAAIEAIAKRMTRSMSGREVAQLAWPTLMKDEALIEQPLP